VASAPSTGSFATVAAAVVLAVAPAAGASPGMGWGQWTSPDLTFAECTTRAPAALKAEGMTKVERYGRVWFGSSAGPVSATIVCYGLAKGAVVTIGAANQGNSGPSGAIVGRLADRIFTTEKPTPTPGSAPIPGGAGGTESGGGAGSEGGGTTTKRPKPDPCPSCPFLVV
jgi:hypothetical protein